jgi:hypothetical protein
VRKFMTVPETDLARCLHRDETRKELIALETHAQVCQSRRGEEHFHAPPIYKEDVRHLHKKRLITDEAYRSRRISYP